MQTARSYEQQNTVNIPFTAEAFFGDFAAYNSAVWPMQLPLLLLGVFAGMVRS